MTRATPDTAAAVPRYLRASLAACLVLCIAALAVASVARWIMVEKVSAASFRDTPAADASSSLGPGQEHLVLPNSSVDARWWVIHTKKMLRDGTWRVRSTSLDNAPEGREVHWSSFLMWTLALLAWLRSWGTSEPAASFVADAALAVGPVLMIVFFTALWWVARRAFGSVPAMFYLLVLLSTQAVVRTFELGEADHHGIVLVFASACALCLLGGGAGFAERKDQRANRWFIASGLSGAAALWVSASTTLPILGGLGAGGLLAGLLCTHGKRPPLRPDLWLTWGLAGFLASLGFYLLEYFPSHMSWRLEVNHPLYAFAWLGAAWLLTRILQARRDGKRLFQHGGDWVKAVLCVLLATAPVAAVLLAGDRVFWVSDAFLLALHKEYISEFQSFTGILRWKGHEQNALVWIILYFWIWIIFATTAAFWLSGNIDTLLRRSILLLLPATAVMQILALWQVRWSSAAFALWALWALVVAAAFLRKDQGSGWRRRGMVALSAIPWVAFLLGPLPVAAFATMAEKTSLQAPLRENIGGNLIIRDIAHRLLEASPGRVPTVLSGPNTSTELVYHGSVRTLGTLYWENMPGLKRAAEIFAASTEEEAKKLLAAAGVTHIVVPSWSNFGRAYAALWAEARGLERPAASWLDTVLQNEEFPVWLRPFAYPIPTASGIDSQSVRVVAFIPEQNEFEAHFYRGIYHFESGQPKLARAQFEMALALRPGEPRVQAYLAQLGAMTP